MSFKHGLCVRTVCEHWVGHCVSGKGEAVRKQSKGCSLVIHVKQLVTHADQEIQEQVAILVHSV